MVQWTRRRGTESCQELLIVSTVTSCFKWGDEVKLIRWDELQVSILFYSLQHRLEVREIHVNHRIDRPAEGWILGLVRQISCSESSFVVTVSGIINSCSICR